MTVAHIEKEYSIFQVALNLAGACFISGAIIAGTYFITSPSALRQTERLRQLAMRNLVKQADIFKPVAGKTDWFEAEKAGKVIAYVVPGDTKGYGGEIKLLVAVTSSGEVIDYNILSSNETPGLGQNASKDFFRNRFRGKKAEQLTVVKDPANKENIEALTGATISSVAVTKGIKEAVLRVTEYTGGK